LHNQNQRRIADRELQIELTRGFMALFANANRDPKKHAIPYMPHDFYRLSYDVVAKIEDDPDLFRKLKQKFGSTVKNITPKKRKKGRGDE
jgi:hypothetical protein